MSLAWRYSNLLGLVILCTASSAHATEVNVVGLFNGKAMVSINGGKHRVMASGETSPEGVKLISADSTTAVLEIDGKRQNLGMGKSASIPSADGGGNQSALLAGDLRGHFVTTGSINGTSARMMVDTGASMVSMGKDEAKRLGISYLNGERGSGFHRKRRGSGLPRHPQHGEGGQYHAESGRRSGAGKQHAFRTAWHELPEKAGDQAGRD